MSEEKEDLRGPTRTWKVEEEPQDAEEAEESRMQLRAEERHPEPHEAVRQHRG